MQRTKGWSRLDNAAIIFPPTSTNRDSKVFRIFCQITQPIVPELLQSALDATMPIFPLYRSVLKKGLFWHYFEESPLVPAITEETRPPCMPLYRSDRPRLLFQVSYYDRRINLEVFHALSDGTGATQFLRTLVYKYLLLAHPELSDAAGPLNPLDPSAEELTHNAFDKYYDKKKHLSSSKGVTAYHIRSSRLPDYQLGIIEGTLSVRAVLEITHRYDATLSEFLTALLLLSLYDGMKVRDRAKPVVITVPVDLRRYFPTPTARNFFSVIQISHTFSSGEEDFPAVLSSVTRAYKAQLTQENMAALLNRYTQMENSPWIKLIPLAVKIPCLRLADWWVSRQDTAALSNVGKVTMPQALEPLIHQFGVYVSTRRPQMCVCSYGDLLTLSISSPMTSTDLQRSFFRRLTQLGLDVAVLSNLPCPVQP